MTQSINTSGSTFKASLHILPILEEFRKISPILQMQQAVIFVHIGATPGVTLRDLERLCGLGSAAVSRNVSTLGVKNWKGEPGFGLVESKVDPDDRRYKRVSLAPKGQRIYETLKLLATHGQEASHDGDT